MGPPFCDLEPGFPWPSPPAPAHSSSESALKCEQASLLLLPLPSVGL